VFVSFPSSSNPSKPGLPPRADWQGRSTLLGKTSWAAIFHRIIPRLTILFRHKRGAVLSQYETERHAIDHHRWMVLHGSGTHQNFVTRRMNGKWTSFWKEITQQLSITTTKIVAVSTPRVDFETDGSKFKVHNFEQVLPPVPRFTNTSEFDRSTLQLPWPKHLQKIMLQKDGWIFCFLYFCKYFACLINWFIKKTWHEDRVSYLLLLLFKLVWFQDRSIQAMSRARLPAKQLNFVTRRMDGGCC
jgi:hypothetical protein